MAIAPCQERLRGSSLRRGLCSRLLAASVSLAFATASWPVEAVAAQDAEVERLYVEGQDKYAEGDFEGAADAWSRLLDRLPEAQANRATRENVLLNVLQAHLDGYNRNRRDDGSKDITHLHQAKANLDQYFANFKKAYGDRAAVSTAVQEKADEVDRALADAEQEAATTTTPDETNPNPVENTTTTTTTNGEKPNVIVLEAQDDGQGLIVGGAVMGALGLGGIGLTIAGAVISQRAEVEFNNATSPEAQDDAETRGRTGNALTITGAIIGPVLLISGGVLVGLGLKRRKDARAAKAEQLKAVSVVPTAGRGFGGLVLQGRF